MSEVGAAGMGLWLSGGDQEDQKPESWCPGWGQTAQAFGKNGLE